MKRLILLALALLATPALAQSGVEHPTSVPRQEPSAPSATVQDASADWQMMLRAQAHMAKSVSALAQENEKLKAEIARRDAEAKKSAERTPEQ